MNETGKIFILASWCLLLVVSSSSGFQEESKEYVFYRSFAYAIDRRIVSFEQGTHTYQFSNLPATIQKASLFIEPADRRIEILRHEFDAGVFNFAGFVDDHRGDTILLSLVDGHTISGVLYNLTNTEIILESAGAITAVNRNRVQSYTIEGMAAPVPFEPVLRIHAASPVTLRSTVQIHYLVDQIGWTGEYAGMFEADKMTLSVKSRARLWNNSGENITTGTITLIAGEPHMPGAGYPRREYALRMQSAEQPPLFSEEKVHIFYKFFLPQSLILKDNSEQQIRLFPDKEIDVSQHFIFDVGKYGENVVNVLEFSNDGKTGFGEPIPSGAIRLYQADDTGSIFLGGDTIEDTPVGKNVTLQIGTVFDITGKRTQKQLRRTGERSREETYEIELTSAAEESRVVIVREHFTGEWRILESSEDFTLIDSRTAEFTVPVAPGGRSVVGYTVRIN